MGKSKFSFFLMNIILLVVSLGMINMVFNLHKRFLILEVLFLLVAGFFALVSMVAVYSNTRWGWVFLSYIFGLVLVDILFIYYIAGKPEYFFLVTLIAMLGFIVSLLKIGKDGKDEDADFEEISEEETEEVTKEFNPGKYVASKTGKKYHTPKCDWAKRIKKSNQVWFDDQEEAKQEGYKSDSCVK